MERNKVDTQLMIKKRDCIVVSLADFNEQDTISLSNMLKALSHVLKEVVYVPLFDNERELCPLKVWETLSYYAKMGKFAAVEENNYNALFNRLGKNTNTVYVIAKNEQIRKGMLRSTKGKLRVVFCDLDSDGQLYWRKREFVSKQRDYVIATTPTVEGIRKLVSTITISEGSVLFNSSGEQFQLVKKELRNNGAYTYSTNKPGIWAKIYDEEYSSSFFEDKVCRMLKNPVNVMGVLWPKGILRDANGVFRGFLIDEFYGYPLQTSIFKRDGMLQYFRNWTKIDICTLTLTILNKIMELHKRGILLGCINPATIRVVDPNTVFFCDTDDYQVEGYPSLSNNISFAAPENLGKRVYLASLDSENFSVAELVFMLLMSGKTPYLSGNSNVIDTIKRMRFPFFINDYDERNPGNNILPSMWRYMWSHLSFGIKRNFCSTFQRNMPYSSLGRRLPVYKWYQLVEQYRSDIKSSSSFEDKVLFPTTFQKREGDTFYECKNCHKEHPKFFFDKEYFEEYRICNVCMDLPSNKSYTCVDCGVTYTYKLKTALYHHRMKKLNDDWKDQRHCPICKAKKERCQICGQMVPYYELSDGLCRNCQRSTVYIERKCSVCGRNFSVTYEEKKNCDQWAADKPELKCRDYYPKKCKVCRGNKR